MSVIKMRDLNIAGKRVLIRADLNVPIKDNQVTSDARIRAALPTLRWALQQGAYVMVTSHLGRPTEGEYHEQFSLLPVARHLQTLIDAPVRLVRHYLEGLPIAAGELVMLENVRFNRGEKHNDLQLAQRYAALCDLFVMDAFGTAHRAQASTHGVAQLAPMACAGPLLCAELTALNQALLNPARPLVAVVAGSKVSTKLPLLNALAQKVNQLIVGGGICNTFIAAQGYSVGRSLYEADLIPQAKQLLATTTIPMPSNVQVATCFSEQAIATLKHVSRVAEEDYILDLGEQSAQHLSILLKQAKTIIWNGPVGVFEFPQFARGTEIIARAIAESDAFSIAGGGDTLAVIDHFGIADKISYISTGGGAFLEFLQGTTLPAVEVLEQRAQGALLKQGQ